MGTRMVKGANSIVATSSRLRNTFPLASSLGLGWLD